jgi:AcrR family transcriptional regulator
MTIDDILTPAERRQRNREEVINNILEISRQLMRENGVAALSFNEIARRLGMKPPSLYTYFPSKMAIYDALFRQGMEMFAELIKQSSAQGGTMAEQFQRVCETYMAFATENPELYQLVFERPIPGFEPSEESMAVSLAALEESRQQFAQLIADSGLDVDLPAPAALDLSIAVMHGLTALHMANEPHLPVGEGRFGSLIPDAAKMFTKAWPIKK